MTSASQPAAQPLLPVGARVRHAAEQYPKAYRYGTATVTGYAVAGDGTTEYVVVRDQPLLPGGPTVAQWQTYRTDLARP
jgi:hypothetical protein